MNSTSLRIAKLAGAGIAGLATSVVVAAPALAIRPEPASVGQASQATTSITGSTTSTSGGMDLSSLSTGLGSGVLLGGAVVIGAAHARRRRDPQFA